MFGSLNRPAGQSVFGGNNASAFGQSLGGSTQQTQLPQQQQQQQLGNSLLGQSQQLGSSIWTPGRDTPHQKSIPEQIKTVTEKWDPASPNCTFKTYFYNKVDEDSLPFYRPGPNDDPKEWEEALKKKPAPGFVPVVAAGFPQLAERIKLQRVAVGQFNRRLHEINALLDGILSRHDLETTVQALNARRRHAVLAKRCLALAAKVQVLRNRGYSLSADEDELRQKLETIERGISDPAVSARMEELWGRLATVRMHAEGLKTEINKRGMGDGEGLSEDVEARAKKILEDYDTQLQYLRAEVEKLQKEFAEWEKDHNPVPANASR